MLGRDDGAGECQSALRCDRIATVEEPPYIRVLPADSRLGPFEVLVSYAHEDESMRQALEAHPFAASQNRAHRALARSSDRPWSRLVGGNRPTRRIRPHHLAADQLRIRRVRLLLRYRDDACSRTASGRGGEGDPCHLHPCQWDELSFAEIQALPTDARPIALWETEDQAYLTVADGLRSALERLPRPEIVTGNERFSPSSLVALRTNFLLRPGRLRPGTFRLVAPNLAYQYESFVVNGVWDGTHLDRVDHSAIVSVVNGHVLDYARA